MKFKALVRFTHRRGFWSAWVAPLAFIAQNASAQWEPTTSLPLSVTGMGACADDVGRVFALGGTHCCPNVTIDAGWYLQAGVWSSLPTLPMPTTRATVVWTAGYVYLIGGHVSADAYESVSRLDTTTDPSLWQWEELTASPLPSPRRAAAGVVDRRGRIWVIGGEGSDGVPNSTALIFDPSRPHLGWVSGPEMNEARAYGGAAMDREGRLYCIGGSRPGLHLSTVERFDPRTPEAGWVYVASIPGQAPQVSLAATASDGGIYIAGGWTGSSCMSRSLRYDPDLDQWSTSDSMGTSRNSVALAASADGYVYAIGGGCVGSSSAVERMSPPPLCPGDFNRDNTVDFFDYDAFVQAFELGC